MQSFKLHSVINSNILHTFNVFCFSGDDCTDSLSELVIIFGLVFEKILKLLVSFDASYKF